MANISGPRARIESSNYEDERREIAEEDSFLDAWSDWHDSGVRQRLMLDPMHRLIGLVNTTARPQPDEPLHGGRKPHECMCATCVDNILFHVCHCDAPLTIFCEENIVSVVCVWQRLKNIFPCIVDFRSFCCAICRWNIQDAHTRQRQRQPSRDGHR